MKMTDIMSIVDLLNLPVERANEIADACAECKTRAAVVVKIFDLTKTPEGIVDLDVAKTLIARRAKNAFLREMTAADDAGILAKTFETLRIVEENVSAWDVEHCGLDFVRMAFLKGHLMTCKVCGKWCFKPHCSKECLEELNRRTVSAVKEVVESVKTESKKAPKTKTAKKAKTVKAKKVQNTANDLDALINELTA